jgi:peptidoglycan/LPS O-acetylase OafA/YrhL
VGTLWEGAGAATGTWGVGVFFILSGTCIHLPVARQLARGEPPSLDLARYFKRRLWRIYPPHALVIFLSWLVAWAVTLPQDYPLYLTVPTTGQFWAHIFMVHTFVPGAYYSINTVLWTIAIEAHFYLLYPLLLRLRRRVSMLTICGALFGIMVGLRVLDHFWGPPWREVLSINFPGRWWEWVLGATIAEWLVRMPQLRVSRAVGLGAAGLSLLMASVVVKLPHGILLNAVFGPFVYAVVVLLCARIEASEDRPLDRLLIAVGFRSYSLYLTHPIALTLVAAWTAIRVAPPPAPVLVALVASYGMAGLYFALVESRFLAPPAAPLEEPRLSQSL